MNLSQCGNRRAQKDAQGRRVDARAERPVYPKSEKGRTTATLCPRSTFRSRGHL